MIPALGELKAIAGALLLPPASPLLLAAAGLFWLRHRVGRLLIATGLLALWLLSCNAVAVLLAQRVLPPVNVLEPSQQAQLGASGVSGVQAIVVLGGGLQTLAPEYGQAQPNASTAARLRYGIHLAKREMRIVIESFLSRMNNIRIPDGESFEYHTTSTIGVDRLPLAWDRI